MKILYCTDLHGNHSKYKKLLELSTDFDLLIVGADILPKQAINLHTAQYFFIRDFLPPFFSKIKIPIIIDFGNDDFKCFYNEFKKIVKLFDNVKISHRQQVVIKDISFLGLHFVPDYPFALKDWCRQDNEDYIIDPIQYGLPCTSGGDKFLKINNLSYYFSSRSSIKQSLNLLPKPTTDKAIYLFHSPPRTLGLDVCCDGRAVGSRAITNFIEERQPDLCLSGHIHESFNVTGLFYNKINKTICVQPGQSSGDDLIYCSFETDDIESTLKRHII